ncbi:MAG: acetoacetate--CoA ligase [Acidiferrobacterales bacterium]
MATPLWKPSEERIKRANITAFIDAVRDQWAVTIPDYPALYQWSVDEPEKFWRSVWSFADVRAAHAGDAVLEDGDKMPGAQWFPDARLNFAENLLRSRGEQPAIFFWGENQARRALTQQALYDQVSQLTQALRAKGVVAGDRVVGYLPNVPEAVIAMLAATSLGAVWSSCSPDFGVQGVVDRFGQIAAKVLFSADGYFYNGKPHDSLAKLKDIVKQLPSLEQVVVVPYVSSEPSVAGIDHGVLLGEFVAPYTPAEIDFVPLPFNHPLYIMYSSGTTGVPKCIVHGAGGTLIQHLKEHLLHVDLKPGDRLFYFTTCGWMMWNWLVSGLASGATLMFYDGSPFYPDGNVVFDFADAHEMTVFGTSAKYIDAVSKAGLEPIKTHRLESMQTILSTGSPLVPEGFDFVYEKIKHDVCLSSISGGTDIISCFVLGNPTLPVWRGELQCRGLGMRVEVYTEEGKPVRGEKGELVCTAPFPSMPIGFWNDPDGKKYRNAYFEKFPGVWCHGDYVELTEHDGIIFYGRSDAVLNPGGIRIGTAEIYRQAEQIDEVMESLVIGQQWQGDVRVVLFVRLRDGLVLDDALIKKIKQQIRRNTTPRHVPAKVIQVADIPRTKSGKIVELAVRNVVHSEPVKNMEALANPEALELFRHLDELRTS